MSKAMTRTLMAASLCCLASQAAMAQESALGIRLNADIRSTDPGMNRDANSDAVVLHMVEGLVAFGEDAAVRPMLAEYIDISEDGTAYTFALREGVTFHNGEPLTSEDVVFAWNRYMDPANNWRCLEAFDGSGNLHVTGVEAVDAGTVRFDLASPSALFLVQMARPDCGGTGIYHADSLDADGNWDHPVGTGPFVFESWTPDQRISLVRNENYASLEGERDGLAGDKTPLVDQVNFIVIPDASAAKAALLSGGLDVVFDVASADRPDLEASNAVTLEATPTMEMNAILLQTTDDLIGNQAFRQALRLSLDLPAMVETLTNGMGFANNSPIPMLSAFHGPVQKEVTARDLDAAKALLDEAGYAGETIKLVTTQEYRSFFDQAILMQAMAMEAGINVELEVLDWGALLDRYRSGDYQLMSFGYSARLDPSLSFEMISGDKSEQPRKVWDNAEQRALLAESMLQTDPAERQATLDLMETMMREEMPIIPIYNPLAESAVANHVKGFAGWSLNQPRAWGVSINN